MSTEESVWYKLGMRNGKFFGVNPCVFLDTLQDFFKEITEKTLSKYHFYKYPAEAFTKGHGRYRIIGNNMCTFRSFPHGTPVPADFWESAKPVLSDEILYPTEETILGEEIIRYPAGGDERWSRWHSVYDTEWEKQRYRLIQKMRYCIVPLKIYSRYQDSYNVLTPWRETNSLCLNDDIFSWGRQSYYGRIAQLKLVFDDYWCQDGVKYKIAFNAKDIEPGTPVRGDFWIEDKEYTTPKPPPEGWEGISSLEAVGIVDLSTHPDFVKYFETTNNHL